MTWYLIQIPNTRPDSTQNIFSIPEPDPTRPEVEKPYPSDPEYSWWTWQSLRQSCPHWGVISSCSRPLWFSLWSAVSRVFCKPQPSSSDWHLNLSWLTSSCNHLCHPEIPLASSRSRSTGEVTRSDQSIDTRTGHWTSIWTARDAWSFNSIS